jgi:hypothetical protein
MANLAVGGDLASSYSHELMRSSRLSYIRFSLNGTLLSENWAKGRAGFAYPTRRKERRMGHPPEPEHPCGAVGPAAD